MALTMLRAAFPASAFDHLSAPAVVCGGRKTSFRDLLAHSARLAREFRKRLPRVDAEKQGRAEAEARAEQQLQDGEAAEAAEGPRIAIFGRPGTDYVAAMWAAWAAGGVAVPLCESYPPEELLYVLKDSGACLIVGPEACRPVLAPLAAEAAAAFVPSDPLEGKELEERDADEEKAGIEALKNVPFSHAGVPWGAVGCWVPWGAVGCCGVPWGAVGCCEHSAFASYVLASDPLEGKKLEERNADEEKAGIEALKNVPFSHAGGVRYDSVGCRGVLCGAVLAALIVYTSGTTGRPKGVVHSHIGLASQAGMLVDAWDFSPSDRVLNVLPLHHIRPHAPFHPLFLLPHRLHCPCTFSTCLILLYPFSTCVAAAPYPPTRTFPSPLSPATHRLHCPCPFSTCLILLYPFSTCAASAPYPPTCTFPSPLSPATHRLPCPCPFSTCLILLYPFSTCAAAAPYPPIHTSPCFSLPATHHLPCPFPYTSQQALFFLNGHPPPPPSPLLYPLPLPSSCTLANIHSHFCHSLFSSPSSPFHAFILPSPPFFFFLHSLYFLTFLHAYVEFLPSHRFSAAAVWQRWRESYPDGSAVVITRPPSLPLPLSRPVLPSFSGRVPPIPLPRKSSSQAIAWETKKVELLPSHRFSAAPMWQRWKERGVHVSLHHCSPPLHTLAPFPPRPSFSPATASAQQPCGSGGERATPTGGALRAARLHHILHRGANQAKPLRAAAAGVHATFSPLPPVPPRSSSSPTIASVQRLCGSAGEKGELPRRESSSSPTIASAQQQCGSAGGREGRMCRCITALHPLAHPFTPLSPITFRSSSSPTTASAQQPCGSGGEKATPMVAAPSRNLFTAPSLTSLSSRRSSFSPATTSAQQPCGSGGERATPMGAHATSPPLPTSSHLFPLALTPSIAPHAPVTGRIPPQPSLQRSSRVAAVARKLPRRPVEFFPSHRFSAAAVWQRWRESYPDGRCAQPDSITFFTGVPTHYMRLLQEFDRMPLQLQRKSALAASKLRLMVSRKALLSSRVALRSFLRRLKNDLSRKAPLSSRVAINYERLCFMPGRAHAAMTEPVDKMWFLGRLKSSCGDDTKSRGSKGRSSNTATQLPFPLPPVPSDERLCRVPRRAHAAMAPGHGAEAAGAIWDDRVRHGPNQSSAGREEVRIGGHADGNKSLTIPLPPPPLLPSLQFAMALTNPLLGEKKSGSVGVPLRGVKVSI
ncbi:unnamed protein product [Closterium sp. NIES-65]|nr:unnamed protein product [Closterium sp. NIES-65]